MDPEHLTLPQGEPRERLLLALANVVARAGWERFVAHPILEATPGFFPDTWHRSARGAYRLARRLLVYAGLDDRDVNLLVFRTSPKELYRPGDGSSYPEGPEHAAATYRGTSDDAHHFGIEVQQLLEDETLVASMCHEVAHAYRAAHGLVVTTSATEEQLTDLTTVYLGFGLLTLNGSYRYRTGGAVRGGFAMHSWSQSTLGYLGAGDMALLFAAQVVARGSGAAVPRRLADQMELTQATLFLRAVGELESDREALLHQLGLPPADEWPPAKELAPFLRALKGGRENDYDDEPPREVTAKDTSNQGKPVFRVRHTRATAMAMLAGILAMIPGIALGANGFPEAAWIVAVAFAAGYFIGSRQYVYACSDPSCETGLERGQLRCPGCDGVVSGTIRSAKHRLAAEEDLQNGAFQSLD